MMFELIYLAIMLLVAFSILSLLPLGRKLFNQGKIDRKLEKIVEYHSNGRIKYSGEIAEGKKIGMHRYFHDNGMVSRVLMYSPKTYELLNETEYLSDGVWWVKREFIKNSEEFNSELVLLSYPALDECLVSSKKFMVEWWYQRAGNFRYYEFNEDAIKKCPILDKEIARQLVEANGLYLAYLNESQRADCEIVLSAVSNNYEAIQYAGESLISDFNFMVKVLKKEKRAIKYFSDELLTNPEVVYELLDLGFDIRQLIPNTLKKDGKFVIEVFSHGNLRRGPFNVFRTNIIDAYSDRYVNFFNWIDSDLLSDKEFIISFYQSVTMDRVFCLLYHTHESIINDKEVILKLLQEADLIVDGGAILEIIGERLRSDREVVLSAVRNSGYALRFASKTLRDDKDFVLAVVSHSGEELQYASTKLRGDKDVALAAVNEFGYALQYASTKLRGDKSVVLAAVNEFGSALQFVSTKLRGDKDVVLAAVNQSGEALQYASTKLRGDKDVALAAIKQSPDAKQYVLDILKKDNEVVNATVSGRSLPRRDLNYASKYHFVTAPMAGTFYRAPSPDKPSYVNVGDTVEVYQSVCMIESMKLFNEIECEVSGTVVKVLAEDMKEVEYGQLLFLIRPASYIDRAMIK